MTVYICHYAASSQVITSLPYTAYLEKIAFTSGEGYFLVKDYWGCATRWGRIFTTGLNIMGLHF